MPNIVSYELYDMRSEALNTENLKTLLLSLCLPFLVNGLLAQQNLRFETLDNMEYVVKIDPTTNALTIGDESYFLPWLPQNQFGWQIQDQNYLDLFFEKKNQSNRKLKIDFYENLVLAIVKYDTHPWQLQVQQVQYYPKRHHIHLVYAGIPQYQRAYAKQTSSLLVIIEQNRRIQKQGDRNLTYSVEKVGDDPEFITMSGPNPTEIFPLAFTNTHIEQQNNREIELSKYMQVPESLVEGNREGLSREELDRIERDEIQARNQRIQKERERRERKIAEEQNLAASREREEQIRRYDTNKTNDREEVSSNRPIDRPTGRPIENSSNSSAFNSTFDRTSDPEEIANYLSLSFTEARGYMARRDIQLDAVNYLVFENKLDWDAYLKTVPRGMTNITSVDESIFRTHIGLAVIKKGNTYWEMEPYAAWQNDMELRINYEAILTRENLGWEAATLFVVFVERKNVSWVSFIQNGQKMQQVKVNR